VRSVVPLWEEVYPARAEPRRIVEDALAWSDGRHDRARAAAATADALADFIADGSGPAREVAGLSIALADLPAALPGSTHDLGALVVGCVGAHAVAAARHAASRSRDAAIAAGGTDYDGWQAARRAGEEAARRALDEGLAERAVRVALDELVVWLLDPDCDPALAPEPAAVVEARRRARPCLRAAPRVVAGEGGGAGIDDIALHVAAHLLPFGGLLALAASEEGDARKRRLAAERARKRLDDPRAVWDCPRCGALTRNTSTMCTSCGFKLA
jgi:hypothetical protein